MYIDTIFAFYRYEDLLSSFLLLSWMFEHDCLDTCCFGCLIVICMFYILFCTCTCSAQLSMFDMERRSRNTIISIVIFTTIIITKVKDASRATMQIYIALRYIIISCQQTCQFSILPQRLGSLGVPDSSISQPEPFCVLLCLCISRCLC